MTAGARRGWERNRVLVTAADVEAVVRQMDEAQASLAEVIYRRYPEIRPGPTTSE